jgi:hypothetical protein
MLTIIILTGIAIIALGIGFFDLRFPLINKNNNVTGKKNSREPSKNIESFYRTTRVETWLYNIEQRRATEVV